MTTRIDSVTRTLDALTGAHEETANNLAQAMTDFVTPGSPRYEDTRHLDSTVQVAIAANQNVQTGVAIVGVTLELAKVEAQERIADVLEGLHRTIRDIENSGVLGR